MRKITGAEVRVCDGNGNTDMPLFDQAVQTYTYLKQFLPPSKFKDDILCFMRQKKAEYSE